MPPTDPHARARGRNAPQAAARHLLAGGGWVSAAEFADLIRDAVTDADAERCCARLERAGHDIPADPAERDRIGRERLAQEPLQRLVQRGEAEAAGTGAQRRYRLTTTEDRAMFAPRPKPRREFVPLERIAFPLELQMRDIADPKTGANLLFSEEWVERLLELRREGVELEPLELVEESRKGKEPVLWAFRGFHRGEARRRNGENSVECLIYPGTFADAQFYALSENGKQPLPRTSRDCRRAFDTLIETPDLLKRAIDAAPDQGGVHRALAAACGISHGAVGKYLAERGVQVDRKTRKLVSIELPKPKPAPAPEPEPEPEPEPVDPADAEPDDAPPARAALEPAPKPAAVATGFAGADLAGDTLANLAKLLRAVGRDVEWLLSGESKVSDRVIAAAKAHQVPFEVTFREVEKLIPHEVVRQRVVTWPALVAMQAAFAQVSADLLLAAANGER